jgi:hypothetical protein
MPTQIPKLKSWNKRGRYKTWRFNGVLTPTDQIHADINWIVNNDNPNIVHLNFAGLKVNIINRARPDCVMFISLLFSREDAASWVSNTSDKPPLSDQPFKGC